MKLVRALLVTVPVALTALSHAHEAAACGGCFVSQTESTQVTGHRMILSVSNTATTLWDQITYSGNPAEFAWVLPIHGTVDVETSSDALFNNLEQVTAVTVASPTIQCPQPPDCDGFGATGSSGAGGGSASGEDPVQVLAQEVVGPYETAQLASDDPLALQNWLTLNGYNVPADIAPVIAAYVDEGLNFLALKLAPGEGVDSMKPVRITTAGAAPTLPLRMVAAGTGATTAITLWVMGEGRYQPSNFPAFEIAPSDLVWDWDAQKSNYSSLKAGEFEASGGFAWLMEAGEPFAAYDLEYLLTDLVTYDPKGSGYGDAMGVGAMEACLADLDALYGSIDMGSVWVTRMHAELSRPALATDLTVGAAANQSVIPRYLEAASQVGTPPACPEFQPCDDTDGTSAGSGDSGDTGGIFGGIFGPGSSGSNDDGGCAVRPEATSDATRSALGVGLLLALAALVRRRRRRAAPQS
jgi:MYXO-CTERM domain-containing protein